jgi:hypothetical protein
MKTQELMPAICGIVSLLFVGCVSLIEKTGQTLDRSVPSEKQTAIYRAAKKDGAAADMEVRELRNKAGERSVVITLNQYPAMKIRGTTPNDRGEFELTSLDYLGGNPQGWNEYRMDLFGSGSLVLGDTTARLSIPGDIEAVQIAWGRIRRYDTRITGSEALTNLRNRRERILALAEWLNTPAKEGAPSLEGGRDSPAGADIDAFEDYWKPLLFPEVVSRRNRPEDWQREGDRWVRAEDIRWNSSYTERVFPEELWNIRNSGTMLRDWEEAIEWIYIEYEWPRITEILSRETVLNKARK